MSKPVERWNPWLALVAGIPGVAAAAFWLLCVDVVLRSRLSDDPASDPHGYALMFGTVLSVPAAILAVAGLTFAVPPRVRVLVLSIAAPVFLGGSVLLFAVLFSS
ncbi:hypothetical protein [Nocardia sp. NPDC051832]|uniref:hypothetical protein n=1 Tax=Nocardia sp. NPDC051832 TaxID=3155673 RepID=UPI0034441F4F